MSAGRFCDACGADQGFAVEGRARQRIGLVIGVVAIVLAAAVTSVALFGSDGRKTAPGVRTSKQIASVSGGEVSADGATVTLPPGALSADATVTLLRRSAPSKRPSSPYLRALSGSYEIETRAASLLKPVEVSIAIDTSSLPPNLPPEAFVLAYFDTSSKTWTGVDTTIDAARHALKATTPHLSEWQAFAADTVALSKALVDPANRTVNAALGGTSTQKCFPDSTSQPNSPVTLTKVPADFKVDACVEGTATQFTQEVRMVNHYAQPVLVDFSPSGPTVRAEYLSGPNPPNRFEQLVRDRLYAVDLLYVMPGESFAMRTTFGEGGSGTAYFRVGTIIPAVIHFIAGLPLVDGLIKAVPCIADYALGYRPSKTATFSDYVPVVQAAVLCLKDIWLDIIAGSWRVLDVIKKGMDVVELVDSLDQLGAAQAAGGYVMVARTEPDPPAPTTQTTTRPAVPTTVRPSSVTTVGPSSVTTVGRPPAPPTNLLVTAQCPDRFNLTWKDNSDNEAEFRIYEGGIFDRKVPGSAGNGASTVIVFSQLAGSEHTYTVTAWNEFGESAPSNSAYVSRDCRPVPAAPIYDSARVEAGAPCPGPRPSTSSGVPPGSCRVIHTFRYVADARNGLELVLYSDLHGRETYIEVPGGYPACADGTTCTGGTGTFSYDQVAGQQVCFWLTALSGGGESARSNTRCVTY